MTRCRHHLTWTSVLVLAACSLLSMALLSMALLSTPIASAQAPVVSHNAFRMVTLTSSKNLTANGPHRKRASLRTGATGPR